MTEPNRSDNSGASAWPSQSPAHGGRDQFGQPSAANSYQVPDPYSQYSNPAGESHRRPHASFGDAIKLYFKNYAVFEGRASRSEYWWSALFVTLVYIALSALSAASGGSQGSSMIVVLLYAVWTLGNLVPSLAIQVRRLHDTNRSGWWVLISLIPLIGWIWLLVYLIQDSDENAWQTYDKEPLPATE
ncbi:DUF805 domain-containing protein [Cutibacterium equinum]|uniref:DUF805 domain-containing protein n=1 Tax=Cutibacterium equinum TaxID=3016342 RepID=A0ABY7QVN7_9ACTN|nr:DUF805 domain-containing protein [Cutibacterium equinum]WCC79131.1 DUF805 domain-containing protein [Cutibacterium equinum]